MKEPADNHLLTPEMPEVKALCERDVTFRKVVEKVGNVPLRLSDEPFRFLVFTIINQMLSNKAAKAIGDRFKVLCNNEITPNVIMKLPMEELRSIGISKIKSEYLINLSQIIERKEMNLDALAAKSDQEVIKELTSIRGIGLWTAKMYLIFVLNRQNVIPYEDVAFLQGFSWAYNIDNPDKKTIQKQAEKWDGSSTIVALYLYDALDRGFTRMPL